MIPNHALALLGQTSRSFNRDSRVHAGREDKQKREVKRHNHYRSCILGVTRIIPKNLCQPRKIVTSAVCEDGTSYMYTKKTRTLHAEFRPLLPRSGIPHTSTKATSQALALTTFST